MEIPVGRWALIGVAEDDPVTDVDRDPGFPDDHRHGVATFGEVTLPLVELLDRWLAGEEFRTMPAPTPTTGLVLDIAADSTFTETGAAAVPWYDVDGVLDMAAAPFPGRITAAGYVLAAAGEPQPLTGRPDVVRRYDDGDTQVTDVIARQGAELVRTVSVVTDELYPSRIRYHYQRCQDLF